MSKVPNPFPIGVYAGKDYFCDRKQELKRLKEAMLNGRNIRLVAIRRLGKSSLIHHFFASIRKTYTIYIDLYKTRSQEQMVAKIAEETIAQLGRPSTPFIKRVSKALQSFNISLGFDQMTGEPSFNASLRNPDNPAMAWAEIVRLWETQDKPVIVAMDEFQEILSYPEKNTDAMLREYVQKTRNTNFIFSGSSHGMMLELFMGASRPFYQSTEPMHLEKISRSEYVPFIERHLASRGIILKEELLLIALDWCRDHTYYVQYFFNRLCSKGAGKVSESEVYRLEYEILKERVVDFGTVLNLLSVNQAELLIAIANEGSISKPTSGKFIKRYNLSAVSTVALSFKALKEKELIHEEAGRFFVTDVFLSRWLASDN
jgi:hypothetical protein